MYDLFLFGGVIGVWSFLFCKVLTEDGEIFDFYPKAILMLFTGKKHLQAFNLLPKWKKGFLKFLWICPKCYAGQMALWITPFHLPEYAFFSHFTAVTISIFTAYILSNKLT